MEKNSKIRKIEIGLIAFGLFAVLLVLIVPLLIIAKYDVMSADDYAYALMSDPVWNSSSSIWTAFIAEAKMAIEYWRMWQGTYFSEWLSFVLTSAFARNAYYITTWVTVIPLVLSMIYLSFVLVRNGIKSTWSNVFICVIPWIIYQILLPPSAVEAFYWMCGAVLYTTAFAISVFHVAFNVSIFIKENHERSIKPYEVVVLLVLGFVQGGINYIVGLPALCILFFILLFDLSNKNKGSRVRGFLLVWNLFWICVSIFSPGAANRQTSAGDHQSAIWAIIHSFIEAFNYIKTWGCTAYVIALVVIMIPTYWTLVSKCDFKFKCPIIVSVMSFCIYATAFTPNLYALGIIGAYRTQNMYRFMLFILIPANEIYWLGYIRSRVGNRAETWDKCKLFHIVGFRIAYTIAAIAIIAPMLVHYGGNTLTSLSAYYSLRNGTAKLYYEEAMVREAILTDDSVEDAVLEPFTWPPYLLYFDDVSADESDWKNQTMSQYYDKSSVRLIDISN